MAIGSKSTDRRPEEFTLMSTLPAFLALVLSPVALQDQEGPTPIVATDEKVQKLVGGFRFVEGPAWLPGGSLLFSDIPANRIYRWEPGATEASVFLEDSQGANGLVVDARGRLYACLGKGRKVLRLDPAKPEERTVLADAFAGRKLNSPNDLALDGQGGLFFTDPRFGSMDGVEQDVMAVFYTDGREIRRVVNNLTRPNGILVSIDAKTLYVADADRRRIHSFVIRETGKLGANKVLFTGDEKIDGGGSDGMALDERGNLWTTYRSIVVLRPDGTLLQRIPTPENPANCIFGGPDGKTLFITARTGLYALKTQVKGAPVKAFGGE